MDDALVSQQAEAAQTKGTKDVGVDSIPVFSKLFNLTNQILFSLKAVDVANRAVERLKEGKKVVVAFSSTMESFIEKMKNANGQSVKVGDLLDLDYSIALQEALDGVMRYTVKKGKGSTKEQIDVFELDEDGQLLYHEIVEKINKLSTGISLSPIDVLTDIIEKSGHSVAEVTGRKLRFEIRQGKKGYKGVLKNRKKIPTNDAFRQFNDNEVDVLLINQSGSTGASAHAIVTKKVSEMEVKQRVMIVLQPELNINTEVQKRGRINRTGQIYKPIYDYISTAVPAEMRMTMMLQKKLKSLDANTTSNQKQSDKVLSVDDFLNKYGDEIVRDYLVENTELNKTLGSPLKKGKENEKPVNLAHKTSGRVAVLATKDQESFYSEVIARYNDQIAYLKQTGQYDLEVEIVDLDAKTLSSSTAIAGKDGNSVFAQDTNLEKVEINNLKKPYTEIELRALVNDSLGEYDSASEQKNSVINDVEKFYINRIAIEVEAHTKKFEKLINAITNEPKYKKLAPGPSKEEYFHERKNELTGGLAVSNKNSKIKYENIARNITQILKFFYVSKGLNYPTYADQTTPAVCLGALFDKNRSNPFAPSAIKIKIAIADSNKQIDLVLSGDQGAKLYEIMGHSQGMTQSDESFLDRWSQYIKASSLARKSAHIVTGNLLQGFSKYDGRLISYSLQGGGVAKGILMPDSFDPKKGNKNFITVPIIQALDYIKNLSRDSRISTSSAIEIVNENNQIVIYTPTNKLFKPFFTSENLIATSTDKKNGFYKRSNKMVAKFDFKNIKKLVNILQEEFNMSIKVAPAVYTAYFAAKEVDEFAMLNKKKELITLAEKQLVKDQQKAKFRPKSNEKTTDKAKRIRIAKAKAKAKIKILKLKNAA